MSCQDSASASLEFLRVGAVDAQAWHDRLFWHLVSSQGNLLFVDRQKETVTVPVPEMGIDLSQDVREGIVSQFDPEERRDFDRLMADEVCLCCACVLLALVQAAARPDSVWCSDPFALSAYTTRKWLLEAHFRKCLIRQTFDAMKRRNKAEYDLVTSDDTSQCKVVSGA